eukprot:1031708-Alexandrium_andersonii.AAC.1
MRKHLEKSTPSAPGTANKFLVFKTSQTIPEMETFDVAEAKVAYSTAFPTGAKDAAAAGKPLVSQLVACANELLKASSE